MSNYLNDLTTETISAEEYLNLSEDKKASIEEVQIVPPVLGSDDFGKLQVKYMMPIYKDMYGKPIGLY